jgi:hypothetical protein
MNVTHDYATCEPPWPSRYTSSRYSTVAWYAGRHSPHYFGPRGLDLLVNITKLPRPDFLRTSSQSLPSLNNSGIMSVQLVIISDFCVYSQTCTAFLHIFWSINPSPISYWTVVPITLNSLPASDRNCNLNIEDLVFGATLIYLFEGGFWKRIIYVGVGAIWNRIFSGVHRNWSMDLGKQRPGRTDQGFAVYICVSEFEALSVTRVASVV